jgi:hypothetical protein
VPAEAQRCLEDDHRVCQLVVQGLTLGVPEQPRGVEDADDRAQQPHDRQDTDGGGGEPDELTLDGIHHGELAR